MDTILLLSGGLDSTTLLYYLKDKGYHVSCVSFDYGQRHSKELEAAKYVTDFVGCKHTILNLSGIKEVFSGSSLTSDIPMPHGHYKAENMKQTVVPNRNMIMLSIAYALAIKEDCQYVAYAAHAGDHAIYPDCRPEFFNAMGIVAQRCDWKKLILLCPFLEKTKSEIVLIGSSLGVPFDKTWTCYEGGIEPCGKCGSCIERVEAFQLNQQKDNQNYL